MMNARDRLLDDIATGLRRLTQEHSHSSRNTPLECVEVQLWDGEDCLLACDLPTAIDYLANDIYWDESGDWSAATTATVRLI